MKVARFQKEERKQRKIRKKAIHGRSIAPIGAFARQEISKVTDISRNVHFLLRYVR